MPLGTSAFLISENRLEAPLAKIPWLLVQKLVPDCGEEAPGQASDSSRKRTAYNFHGEEVGSDRATKAGRGKPPLFPFPLLWIEATTLSETTQEVMQKSTGGHSARPRWLLSMKLPAVGVSTHLPPFCGRLLVKFHRLLHDMSTLCLLKTQDGGPDVRLSRVKKGDTHSSFLGAPSTSGPFACSRVWTLDTCAPVTWPHTPGRKW